MNIRGLLTGGGPPAWSWTVC